MDGGRLLLRSRGALHEIRAVDGVNLLLLLGEYPLATIQSGCQVESVAYRGVFIASLLVLLGHSPGLRLGKQVNHVEHSNRSQDKLGRFGRDSQTLALGRLSTGTMRTESNPVS